MIEQEQDFVPETTPVVVIEKPTDEMPSDELRKRILELVKNIDANKVELCERLFQAQNGAYEAWGYATFRDYSSRELNVGYSLACDLAKIGLFKSKYPEVFGKIQHFGVGKVRELSRVIGSENVDEWVEKGRVLSVDDLKKEVKTYMKAMVPSEAQAALEKAPEVAGTMVAEQLKHLSYSFKHENYMIVCQAIAALRRANPEITNDAEALALICADYVGTNGSDEEGVEFAVNVLKKYEQPFNLKLVVFDIENEQIVHGADFVRELVKKALAD